MESSGEAASPAPGVWDAGCWVWDAAVVASVLAEPPARGAWGGRDVTGSECFALAPLRWQEAERSVLGSSRLLCYGFAPFLPPMALLALLQGFSFGALVGRGWAAPGVASQLHPHSKCPRGD